MCSKNIQCCAKCASCAHVAAERVCAKCKSAFLGYQPFTNVATIECNVQSAATKLKQVADRKVADQDLINQKDAADITSAEAKLHGGQTPPDSISSKAQVRFCLTAALSLQMCWL